MVNILNDRLYDVPIVQLSAILNTEIVTLMKKYVHGVDQSFMYLKEIFAHEQPIKLYIGGKSNILMQPEFKDVNKVHPFFSMMEKEDELVNLLKNKRSEEHTSELQSRGHLV